MLECPVKILYTELRFFHRGEDGSRYQGEETLISDAERSRGDEAHNDEEACWVKICMYCLDKYLELHAINKQQLNWTHMYSIINLVYRYK